MANKTISQLTAKTTPADADVLPLEDTEDTKKINYSALADAILNKLTSKTYTVAGSSQTLIAAINALNSKATDADKFKIVRYTNVTNASTQTLVDLGAFSTYGSAVVFLRTDSAYDGASAYFYRRNSSGFQVIKIYEGEHAQTPVIDSNGVLKLKSYTSGITVHGCIILLSTWS